MTQLRLGYSPLTKKIYVGGYNACRTSWRRGAKQEVTEDFMNAMVLVCREPVVHEYKGKRYRISCEVLD